MRKAIPLCLLIATLVSSSIAITRADNLPPTDGKMVVAYITRTAPYTDWPLWPGKEKFYKGAHPHGAFLTTYVSPDGAASISDGSGTLPDGSIVVKENYSPGKKLTAITVMYKKEGFNPESGNWYWLKFSPNGDVQQEGRIAGCINCHRSVEKNDWLFTGPVR
ncbi:MAG: hypothetical protein C0615_02700 [Desulfuromonas sp.]|nr:MAG: hypothetical protein C0615_02700 [Desulfuromonas sp.]